MMTLDMSTRTSSYWNPKQKKGGMVIPALKLPVPDKTLTENDTSTNLLPALITAVQTDAPENYDILADASQYRTTNDAQAFEAAFLPTNVQFRTSFGRNMSWGMSLTGYGYGDTLQPVEEAQFVTMANRLEYRRGDLTEWYVNGPLGVEQGFTLYNRPKPTPDSQMLRLVINFTGDFSVTLTSDKHGVRLSSLDDECLFLYHHLYVTDAKGHDLSAHLELSTLADKQTLVHVIVDDRDATYPITVDPLIQYQNAELVASDTASNDNFGYATALSHDGSTAIIGANGKSSSTGAVYIFTYNGSTWTQQAKLTASDAAANDNFGASVILSDDGNTAVIGAYNKNSAEGAAYVFTRSSGTWTQQAKIIGTDSVVGDTFGIGVALSSDGNTTLIGAWGKNTNTGAAYIFTRSGTTWTQQAELTASDGATYNNFGVGVDLSSDGNTAIVGADGNSSKGAAYVYTRSGSTWTQQAKIIANDGVAGDYFGGAVAVSSDGNTALITAEGKNNSTGIAYIFTRSGSTWTLQAQFTANDAVVGDFFGSGGWMTADGNTVVISAVGKNSHAGAAYIFTLNCGNWVQQSEMLAKDGLPGDQLNNAFISKDGRTILSGTYTKNSSSGAAYVFMRHNIPSLNQQQSTVLQASDAAVNDNFGYGSTGPMLSTDGSFAIIGAYGKTSNTGAAYIFTRSNSIWAQQTKLTASDGVSGDLFGNSVGLNSDGSTALVAASGKNTATGAAYIFTRSGNIWTQQAKLTASDGAHNDNFGTMVALSSDGNTALIGAQQGLPGTNGATYVFTRSGSTWTQQTKLTASDGTSNDDFGCSVWLSSDGNTALIGAYLKDSGKGAAYIFTRTGSTWTQQAKIIAGDGANNDYFGGVVALSSDGNTAIITALQKNNGTGMAYIFIRSGSTWTLQAEFTANDAVVGDYFGSGGYLTTDGNTALISSYGKNSYTGAAYIFTRNCTGWTQQTKLTANDGITSDQFGYTGSISGDGQVLIIGAPGKNNSTGAAYTYLRPNAPSNTGLPSEDMGVWAGASVSSGLINLYNGEKQDMQTDIVVQTPAGSLTFQRTYRQTKLTSFQFMGLGWTHNHNIVLVKISGTPNIIVVAMSNGGEDRFTESSPGSNHYVADPGSAATIDYNTGTTNYTLMLPDQSSFIFNASGQIITRKWPTTEQWDYTYNVSGSLIAVTDNGYSIDGSNTKRKLNFSYFSSGSFNGLLQQVSDHIGRTVQFAYTLNKVVNSSGAIVNGALAVLTSVTDTLNNTWTYSYYGEDTVNETDARQLNFMTKYVSPQVDTTGSGVPNTTITLTKLTYTVQGPELIVNGDMDNDSHWTNISGAAPTTNVRSSTQVHTGSYSRHVVTSAANQGIQSDAFNLTTSKTYIVTAWVYPAVGSTVKMQISGTTANAVSSGAGAWQLLRISYVPSANATGVTLQFTGTSATADFYVDTVSMQTDIGISALHEEDGNALWVDDFAFQPNAQNITTETTSGATVTHQFNNGVYGAQVNTDGHAVNQVANLQHRPDALIDTKNQRLGLAWNASGHQMTSVIDNAGNKTQIAYNNGSGNNVAVGKSASQSSNLTGQPLSLTQASNAVDGNTDGNWSDGSVTHTNSDANAWWQVDLGSSYNITNINIWNRTDCCQSRLSNYYLFVSDNPFTSTNLTTTLAQSGVSNYYFSGTAASPTGQAVNRTGRYVRIQLNKTDYLSLAEVQIFDTPPNTINTSTDALGRQTQLLYNDPNYVRLPSDVRVLDTDGVTVLQWQKMTYDTRGRLLTQKTVDPSNGTTVLEQTTRVYYSTAGYGNGLLQTLTQKDMVGSNDSVTTYFYDQAGRVVQVNQNSNFGKCNSTYTVYDNADHTVATLCNYQNGGRAPTTVAQAIALFNATTPLQNRVTTYTFDTLGRQVSTTTDAGASYAQINLTAFDALHRMVRSIRNYVASASISDPYVHTRLDFQHGTNNDQNLIIDTGYNERGKVKNEIGILGNVILYGYNANAWLTKIIQFASNPNYNNSAAGDLSLSQYIPRSDAPDKDLITTMQRDSNGNITAQTDAIGNTTLMVYDSLNRLIKTVTNASVATYNLAADPNLTNYVFSSAADQDVVTTTEYDAMGKVRRTQNALGAWTLYGYDNQDRLVRTILNASQPNYNFTADRSLKSYVLSTATDIDLLSQTIYDLDSRVMETVDVLNRANWTAYDGLNRIIRSIINATGTATDGSTHDPRSTVYNPVPTPDQDQISTTVYDASGRAYRIQDRLGNWTLFGFDALNRIIKTVRNASNFTYNTASDTALAYYVPALGAGTDQDITTQTIYDGAGRVIATLDTLGNRTQYVYDQLDRPIQTINNYITGQFNPKRPDQDLISTIVYDQVGRVLSTTDPRGTITTIVYDTPGRTLKVTRAASTSIATTSYTCYDKLGRVLRTIQNFVTDPTQPSPDARDFHGNWLFNPSTHGINNDQNLITTYTLDKIGRSVAVTDPAGNTTTSTYYRDGTVESMTDPLNVVTKYRYDNTRRQILLVQNFVDNGQDPALWKWNGSNWTKSDGSTSINFGTNNDQNVIVQVVHDKSGRMTSRRDAKGNLTTYTYDLFNRRTGLTDPLSHTWATSYTNLQGGTMQTQLTDPNTKVTQQITDRLGRLASLSYLTESPKKTPDLTFTYDRIGNTLSMTENNGGSHPNRITRYSYDGIYRLANAAFDVNGDGSSIQTVSYGYDAGGLRTTLTLPGVLTATYNYDAKGRLLSMSDWNSTPHTTQFTYDGVNRMLTATRQSTLASAYTYDNAGRLTRLRHTSGSRVLGHFAYTLDARGNRTQAYEATPHNTNGATVTNYNNQAMNYYQGTWSVSGTQEISDSTNAALRTAFFGTDAVLTLGTGPNYGIVNVLIDGVQYGPSVDGYTTSTGTQTVSVSALTDEGPHTLEVHNSGTKNSSSTGYRVGFASVATLATARQYDLQTLAYLYDGLMRVNDVKYYPTNNSNIVDANLQTRFQYGYDIVGNRTQQIHTVNGTPTTTTYTYDNSNRLSGDGTHSFTYDNNGNLLGDGINTYTWDRANRLLSMGGVNYGYDGSGRRIAAGTTSYVLDVATSLWKILSAATGANTIRYVHGPMGLHTQQNADSTWDWTVLDGLGSVRGMTDDTFTPQESRLYSPYGEPAQTSGGSQSNFGFTGEVADTNGLLYLRARYMHPATGRFIGLDPLETSNRYSYASGNPINWSDPAGLRVSYGPNEDPPVYSPPPFIPNPPPPLTIAAARSNANAHVLVNIVSALVQSAIYKAIPSTAPISAIVHFAVSNIAGYITGKVHTSIGGSYPWQEQAATQHAYNNIIFNSLPNSKDQNLIASVLNALQKNIQNGFVQQNLISNESTSTSSLKSIFGYNVYLGDPKASRDLNANLTHAQDATLTLDLLDSSLQIIDYLQARGAKSGIQAFQTLFAHVGSNTVNIYLGASVAVTDGHDPDAAMQGLTPSVTKSTPNASDIYIGTQDSVAGITHEFGHQLNRSFGGGISSNLPSVPSLFPSGMKSFSATNTSLGTLNDSPLTYKAHPSSDEGEILPDYFMTAVLNIQGYLGLDIASPHENSASKPVGWSLSPSGQAVSTAYDSYITSLLQSKGLLG